MDFQSWLRMAASELMYSASPNLDAKILLEHVTKKTRSWILAFGETVLTSEQMQQLSMLLARRKIGEPVAYLTGKHEFWSLPLYVSPATLIPRPDTEYLVECTLPRLPSNSCCILDLGTGTGAIALALASERPDCQVIAVEIIPDAVRLARRNVELLGIQNVHIMQSSWFDSMVGQTFDVIVSNPPYVDEKDPNLLRGDVRFEPHTALVAPEGGLADIRHIVIASREYLRPAGWLLIEHGWTQGAVVHTLFTEAGFHDVETCRDYGGNDRLTLGRWTHSMHTFYSNFKKLSLC